MYDIFMNEVILYSFPWQNFDQAIFFSVQKDHA